MVLWIHVIIEDLRGWKEQSRSTVPHRFACLILVPVPLAKDPSRDLQAPENYSLVLSVWLLLWGMFFPAILPTWETGRVYIFLFHCMGTWKWNITDAHATLMVGVTAPFNRHLLGSVQPPQIVLSTEDTKI